ncbi:DUF5658 family protein [Chloroflexota bacterium]
MKYLLGFLIVFVFADGLLTNSLIEMGIAHEGNPFLQPIVGDVGFLVLKAVGALLCVVILWDIYKRLPKVALITTSFFVVFYGVIVLWNSSLFFLV